MLLRLIRSAGPLLIWLAVSTQNPVPQPTTGAARISGRVTRTDTGAAVGGARVDLLTVVSSRVVFCDEFGRFEFLNVVPGEYWLMPVAGSLISGDATPAQPFGIGRPTVLTAGQDLRGIELTLAPLGLIAGRVFDPSGAPLVGVPVSLAQSRNVGGSQMMRVPSSANRLARTDEEGRYRFADVLPGDYFVLASGGAFARTGAAPLDRATASHALLGYLPTYFPGTDRAVGARSLRVDVGNNPPEAAFSLIPGTLMTMSGSVSDMKGRPVAGASLVLIPTDGGDIQADLIAEATSDPGGRFMYPAIPAGTYELACSAPGGFASRPIAIAPAQERATEISVVLRPYVSARGHVTFEGGPPPDKKDVRISFVPTALAGVPGSVTRTGAFTGELPDDWTFEIKNLAWTGVIRASAPDGWVLKSVRLNGREISTQPTDFQSGDVDGLELVLTNHLASIGGTVTDGSKPASFFVVVIQPEEGSPGSVPLPSGFAYKAGPGGAFTITGLLAGRYRLIAVPGRWVSARDLPALQALATPLSVAEGETKTVALKLVKR